MIVGATVGYSVAAGIHATGILTGGGTVTKAAGVTSSILNSGSLNIGLHGLFGGDMNDAWRAGLAGLATGAWNVTGGFGMVKAWGTTSKIAKLAGKLGYQMTGTAMESMGHNWSRHRGIFSRITLGVGPVNFTLGKGQKLLQFRDNFSNIMMHAYGLVNVAFGAKIEFDWENLSVNYIGGLADKFYDPNIPDNPAGLSPYIVTGNGQLHIPATWAPETIYPHELHHLWQSRAMGNKFLLHYALQGINSLLQKKYFTSDGNYYEDFIENNKWW